MKKKNLNFLLIALAALALVFAGACSDGSDGETTTETVEVPVPYEYTGDYSGETWTYTGTTEPAKNATTITSIELQFAESGNGVVIVVDWNACTGTGTDSACNEAYSSTSCTQNFTATIDDATYTALGGYVGIVLPATGTSGEVTALTFTASASDGDGAYDKLTLAGTNASSDPAYTVADDEDTTKTVDIFGGNSEENALSAGASGSTFSAPSSDTEEEG